HLAEEGKSSRERRPSQRMAHNVEPAIFEVEPLAVLEIPSRAALQASAAAQGLLWFCSKRPHKPSAQRSIRTERLTAIPHRVFAVIAGSAPGVSCPPDRCLRRIPPSLKIGRMASRGAASNR